MKKITLLLCCVVISLHSIGKELKYPSFTISDTLKENAWSVVRTDETVYEVTSLTKTKTSKRIAITVLNENGKKHAWKSFGYSDGLTINKLEYNTYNSLGVLSNTHGRGDLQDISYDPYGTTYTDTRLLVAKPVSNNYPYTVEYYIEYTEYNTYGATDWHPYPRDNQSVESSTFTVSYFNNLDLDFNEKNLQAHGVSKKTSNLKIEWKAENLLATKNEVFSPFYETYRPFVEVGTKQFFYGGIEGSCDSWKSIGAFYFELNKGLDELSESNRNKALNITKSIDNDYDKIKTLYKYMQASTRYISIQVGVGGIQTIDANTVAEVGYGDCKALSNYMMAMLKVVGIDSYIALVQAGAYDYYFNKDFVTHMGNHAILCVPMQNDTIWLECTSQTMPFNFLGDFTDGRHVLLVTPSGGVLTKTPTFGLDKNKIIRTASVTLNPDGNCTAQLTTQYEGIEYDQMHQIAIDDKEEQKKMLYENYDFPNFEINKFNLQNNEDPVLLREELDLSLTKYASKSGSRLFLPLNLASRWTYVPKETKTRTLDIHKKYEAHYTDTIRYQLPEGYSIEVIPDSYSLDSKYGTYQYDVKHEGNSIVYVRSFSLKSGIYAAQEYNDYIAFFKDIKIQDGAMVVLKDN